MSISSRKDTHQRLCRTYGKGEIDIRGFGSSLRGAGYGNTISAVVPGNVVDTFLDNSCSVVLRDDYVPVDNLIARSLKRGLAITGRTANYSSFSKKKAGSLPAL